MPVETMAVCLKDCPQGLQWLPRQHSPDSTRSVACVHAAAREASSNSHCWSGRRLWTPLTSKRRSWTVYGIDGEIDGDPYIDHV